jgi:hypothetical protein
VENCARKNVANIVTQVVHLKRCVTLEEEKREGNAQKK